MEIDFTNPEILKERRVKKDRENTKKNSTKFKNIENKRDISKKDKKRADHIDFQFIGRCKGVF